MNKHKFIILLLSLPLLWTASLAYAQIWQEPTQAPPGGNLLGPAWLFTLDDTRFQVGSIRVTGDSSYEGGILADYGGFFSASSVALRSYSLVAGNWAGYFGGGTIATAPTDGDGNLFAKRYCLPDGADADILPDCLTSWDIVGSTSGLWTLAADGHSIFKTDPAAPADIGATALNYSTLGLAAGTVLPSGIKLGLVGSTAGTGPRLYISNNTGNPEISLSTTSGSTESHWGIYADASGASPTSQLRFWQTDNHFAYTTNSEMIFYGWSPLAGNLTITKVGTGTVTSSPTGISCGATCAYAFDQGKIVILTAVATLPVVFTGWSGGGCSGTGSCTVTVGADTQITATFLTPGAMILTTLDASTITNTTAKLRGTVNFNGTLYNLPRPNFYYTSVNPSGDCYTIVYGGNSKSTSEIINLDSTIGGDQLVEYTAGDNIPVVDSSLSPGTTYYYCFTVSTTSTTPNLNRATQVKSFTTAGAPILTSPTATSITSTTATLGANITSNGGAAIIARGTCWGVAANPITCTAEGGTATGVFTQARSSLTAGTKLYYRGYATNSVGAGYSPDGSFYTEPSTQASAITFSSVGPNSMTVNWTRGNGDGVIVLMKAVSAVNSDPVDGTYTTYNAAAAFGSGTQLGTGNYVIYKGTGTSVAVTGLTGSTTYFVAVYEYKGTVDTSGVNQGTNYKTPAITGSQATGVVVLTVPILTSPTATSIASTTATLGANITSNGGAAIIARGTCWGVAANPITCTADGGTATGVFTQARNSLTAGTKLYYRGYATNSVGIGYSPDGSFYTEPSTQASAITFSSVTSTGMTVNWTRGNGDGVIVLMRFGSAVATDPTDGTYTTYTANVAFGSGTAIGSGYVIYKGTGTSVSVTGLTSSTTYFVAVYEYKGTVDTSGVNQGTNYKTPAITGSQGTGAGGGTATLTIAHVAQGGTVSATGVSSGTVLCGLTCTSNSKIFNQGESIVLTAVANEDLGWAFIQWTFNRTITCQEGGNDVSTCTINMPTLNLTATAVFSNI